MEQIAGPLLGNHTLANINVGRNTAGGVENRALVYFRATENSVLSAARIFFTAVPPGYSAGNGGFIEMKLWPVKSSGYIPDRTGAHLGSATYTPNLVDGDFPGGVSEHLVHPFFGGSGPLIKGNKYVIEAVNTAADSYVNRISVDYFSYVPNAGISEDWMVRGEWGGGVNYGDGASYEDWGVEPGHNSCIWVPCMELHYANGVKFGFASVITGDIHDGTRDRITVATAAAPVRARINLYVSRTIAAGYLYCSARVGGAFNWSLKDGETVLASGSAAAVAQAYTSLFFRREYKHGRIMLDFSGISMKAGQDYDLEIIPTGSTQLLMAANHDGRDGGYESRFAKPEHVAQFFAAGSWKYAFSKPPAYGRETALASFPLVLITEAHHLRRSEATIPSRP